MKQDSRAGVTLLELLVAISLVSLLSVGVLMAMRVGLNAMEKVNDRVISNRRALGAQRVLDQQIGGLIATAAGCQANPGAAPVKATFFQGEPQTMRFVSSYSLQEAHRGYPRILEYQVIPASDGSGLRLVVNEHLYSGPFSTGVFCAGSGGPGTGTLFRPIQVGPGSFVLADRLARCQFSYLELDRQSAQRRERWVPIWTSQQFPLAIRVEMVPLESEPGRVPLITLTAPVRVNKNPSTAYVD